MSEVVNDFLAFPPFAPIKRSSSCKYLFAADNNSRMTDCEVVRFDVKNNVARLGFIKAHLLVIIVVKKLGEVGV